MFNTANQTVIFLPLLVLIALTFVGFVRMAVSRAGAVKAGHDPKYYRAHLGTPEPEDTVAAVRHYGNLFELPTIFYPACVTAFVLGAVNGWVLGFAWAYVAARLLQSAVHMTSNNTDLRAGGFLLGVVFMIGLWVSLGVAIVRLV